MHFGRLSCLFNRHKAQKRSVHWNGLVYEGKCRACHKTVRRTSGGGWRVQTVTAEPSAQDPAAERTSVVEQG